VRVLLLTGKGGVGKTSLALATALGAAAHGHRVCVVSTDAAHSLGDALERPVGARPIQVADGVWAQEVSALAELERSWSSIRDWLQALICGEADTMAAEELLPAATTCASWTARRPAPPSACCVCPMYCAS